MNDVADCYSLSLPAKSGNGIAQKKNQTGAMPVDEAVQTVDCKPVTIGQTQQWACPFLLWLQHKSIYEQDVCGCAKLIVNSNGYAGAAIRNILLQTDNGIGGETRGGLV